MLHEAIFSLLGHPNCLLHSNRQKYLHSNKALNSNYKDQLARVLVIADGYITLKSVIDRYLYHNATKKTLRSNGFEELIIEEFGYTDSDGKIIDESLSPGIYLQALCEALDNELNPYRGEIESLESRALHDSTSVPFTHVVSVAEKYKELFHEFNHIMCQIEKQNIHGCAILDFLHNRKCMTSYDVTTVIERLLFKCHLIFLNQLSQWLFLGKFADAHREFIISFTGVEKLTKTRTSFDLSQHPAKESEAHSHYHDYSINYEMLPSYIVPHVAENILYIGKMVTLCLEDPKNVTKMGVQVGTPKFSIWDEEVELEFSRKLHDLTTDKIFNPLKFQITIEAIRTAVIKHSWQYFVVNMKLIDEISLMRDFFLLGRGELFLEFLYKTDCIRNTAWFHRSSYDSNCNEALKLASRLLMSSDELTIEKFTIHFDFHDYSDQDLFKDKDGWWHTIGMKYNAKWPMHLIFKPVILENYNKLFNFLMRVKKAQRDLTEIWFDQKRKKLNFLPGKTLVSIWQLHNDLIFMVNNLQYYLQVDVIESQFTKLQKRMQESKDFEEIVRAHAEFQANIMSQSFLIEREAKLGSMFMSDNPMHMRLLSLLSLANKFCKTVGTSTFDQLSFERLEEEYQSVITFLLAYMEGLQNHPSGAYVSQLYLRLNYNCWFANDSRKGQ